MCFSFMSYAQALDMLDCHIYEPDAYEQLQSKLKDYPNETNILRSLGMNIICLGRTLEGLSYILQAVDLGDPISATLIASYYKSDKTFKTV